MKFIRKQADRLRRFLSEVGVELRKCSWPTRSELMESTWVVIVSVALLAAFVGLCDVVLIYLLRLFMR